MFVCVRVCFHCITCIIDITITITIITVTLTMVSHSHFDSRGVR